MLRFAMCNEAFGDAPFQNTCREILDAGYTGIEIAPFTLDSDPIKVSAARRRELSGMISDSGLTFVGFHWLLVSPPGLHVTTADGEVRTKSWNYLRALIDLCADLSHGSSVMVFGSPRQRSIVKGTTHAEAAGRFTDGLRSLAPHAESRGVTVLVEALPENQCDVVQSLGEAAVIVEQIDSPAVQTMFDTHNAVDESEPHDKLLERYFPMIRHIHVNETDGRYPGTGDYDFGSVLRTLDRLGYAGWISLEVFDFKPDPVIIARESMHYLKSLL